MKLLILPGIACDRSIWNDIDWYDYEVTFLEYDKYMNEHTKSVEDIANEILKDSAISSYDGIIAHSMGGFIGAILLDRNPSLANFFIAIETSFVPAHLSYQTLVNKNEHNIENRIKNMFNQEINKYPKSLIEFLQGAFNYEKTILNLKVPVTLMYGKRDIKEDELKNKLNLSYDTINNLNIIFIDNVAHFPMLEQPKMTNEIIHKVLNEYK